MQNLTYWQVAFQRHYFQTENYSFPNVNNSEEEKEIYGRILPFRRYLQLRYNRFEPLKINFLSHH